MSLVESRHAGAPGVTGREAATPTVEHADRIQCCFPLPKAARGWLCSALYHANPRQDRQRCPHTLADDSGRENQCKHATAVYQRHAKRPDASRLLRPCRGVPVTNTRLHLKSFPRRRVQFPILSLESIQNSFNATSIFQNSRSAEHQTLIWLLCCHNPCTGVLWLSSRPSVTNWTFGMECMWHRHRDMACRLWDRCAQCSSELLASGQDFCTADDDHLRLVDPFYSQPHARSTETAAGTAISSLKFRLY